MSQGKGCGMNGGEERREEEEKLSTRAIQWTYFVGI